MQQALCQPANSIARVRIEACSKMALAAAGVGIANLLILIVVTWQRQLVAYFLIWTSCALAAIMLRLFVARWALNAVCSGQDLATAERNTIYVASFNSVVWGVAMLGASWLVEPSEFSPVAMLTGGMMSAAIMTYGAIPRAAYMYIGIMAALALPGLVVSPNATWGGPALLATYLFILVLTIRRNDANLVARVLVEDALRESAETVRLLLNDYETQSSDWLIFLGPDGRIESPSRRFSEAAGKPPRHLEGMCLAELFNASAERDLLKHYLQSDRAFRNLTLPLMINEKTHWWTLSASPVPGGRMRGVATDVTAEKRAELRVKRMAHFDGLTDLANRFLFNEKLSQVLAAPESMATVMCLDLDQFKAVNDTLGHPIGDKLLCEVARRLRKCVPKGAIVARLGGDEFAILLAGRCEKNDAERLARIIVHELAHPQILDGMQVTTSASLGIVQGHHGDIDGPQLLKRADLALYAAKADGRNRFSWYGAGMEEAARERRKLEIDLRGALAAGQFEVHYQPLVNLESGKIVSYEALLRWNHPAKGVIMPADFIPLAEKTGLIVQIGEWVIRHACADAHNWPDHLRVAVNVSPAQIQSSSFLATIVSALATTGLLPGRLELEISESILMHDTQITLALLHKLHNFGVRISLDDFGTGYSLLNYLRVFPFDKIKIDRCFVEGLKNREDCRAIVRAVTGLATSLGMTTTAEGVEDQSQLDLLRLHGCTEVQGYLFAHPGRAEEFTDLRKPTWTMPLELGGALDGPRLQEMPGALPHKA